MKNQKARPHAKLTTDQIREIRAIGKKEKTKKVAERFGVSAGWVSQIRNNNTWKWLAAALLIIGTAGPTTAMPTCQIEIQKAVGPFAPAAPSVDCGYAIDYLVVFAKAKGGYYAVTDPDFGLDASTDPIFLKTSETLQKGQRLSGNAAYVEPVSFIGMDGFEHSIPGFVPVPVPKSEPARASVPAVDKRIIEVLAKAEKP